ncbi:MAG: hypothetical protein NW214_16170 [Pseudanabaenaceae cyanobacterium bins.39]|nr:hypothetical protein [Pseudanabaenaceae cyanobacterium bins.39]
MSGVIYIIQDGKRLIRMKQTAYTREEDFQKLLESFPELLAGEQINSTEPRKWVSISRESPIPSEASGYERWYLDNLFLDQDAIPTLVEVKRKSDTRLRREVIGQMLDYAANAVAYWPENEMRRQFADTCDESKRNPDEELLAKLGDEIDVEKFWETAEINLKQGKVRLIFVADQIPPELQRVIEFLNERMSPTEVLGVEIRYYTGEGFSTHIPRVVGQTGEAQIIKVASQRNTWDENSFFEDIERRKENGHFTEQQALLIRQVFDFASQWGKIKWGTGTSRGSFNPQLSGVSKRTPFTVLSDGELYIKLSWLNDKPSAEKFRAIYQAELARHNIPVSDNNESFSIVEWEKWSEEFITATQTAIDKYFDVP